MLCTHNLTSAHTQLENATLKFLRVLSQYDTFSLLVVDINNDLCQSDEKEINDNFLLGRKGQGENGQSIGPVMFLATSYDKASEAWTGLSPSALSNEVELSALGMVSFPT
ncbi:hypothetical protein RIF29_31177 [Crotalaria pallida]|uniref:Nrap protein domain-containing protein n=1 Tax=Crotalaria pallida TaxID=3830 RepID=A0AAN9HYN6_CROPI